MSILLILICLFLSISSLPVYGQAAISKQIRETVDQFDEIDTRQREALFLSIEGTLPSAVLGKRLNDRQMKGLSGVISSGLFDEVEIERIGKASGIALQAMLQGADAEAVTEVAPIGFNREIDPAQLTAAAESFLTMKNAEVPEEIYRQLVSYAVYNNWRSEYLTACAQSLAAAKAQNLPLDKLTLAFIIRIDQGLGAVTLDQALREETDYVRGLFPPSDESRRKDAIFQAMKQAKQEGLPDFVATDFYYNAVEENWTADDAVKLFQALTRGYKKGLTAEKLALAFIIRMETEGGKVPVDKIIAEETAYVESLEQERLSQITATPPPPPPAAYELTLRTLNPALMRSSIESFLGVPYVWGGETRRGADCSGFTRTVYFEQGIIIPRVSHQQYQIGQPVGSGALKFGDLVFFNKNGWGQVSHVGIYVGDGRFAHSCCSQGVTISSFNKRYYRSRYTGAKRITA